MMKVHDYEYLLRAPDGYGNLIVFNKGVLHYPTVEQIQSYVDGILSQYSDPWHGEWFLSEQEYLWTRCKSNIMPEDNLQEHKHVVLFRPEVDQLLLGKNIRKPRIRFRCVRRYSFNEIKNSHQRTNSFLMDKETIDQAKNYVDTIFELHAYNDWKGNWFYSEQEDGWLKFRTDDNEKNQSEISESDHLFIEKTSFFFNYATGHPPPPQEAR